MYELMVAVRRERAGGPRPPRSTCPRCPTTCAGPTATITSKPSGGPPKWAGEILAGHTTKARNGPTEGQNNLIEAVKSVGFGFRTFRNNASAAYWTPGGVKWNLPQH